MTPLAITGIGAVSPVGLSLPATCAALRAGIARLGPIESFRLDDERGDPAPLTGGRVPTEWLHGGPQADEWTGHERFKAQPPPPAHLLIPDGSERLIELAVPAASEAWATVGAGIAPPEDYGLFLGLDENDDERAVGQAVVEALSWRPKLFKAAKLGRAAALAALHQAQAAIAAGTIAGAMVGGVDSLIRSTPAGRLSAAGMLKDDDHPQGIIPGEGAGFLVLETQARRPLAMIAGTGIAEEPSTGSDRPNQGVGLSKAVRAARTAAGPLAHRPLVICDLNGDRYRALEWGLVSIRALGDLRWPEENPRRGEFWHPADCIGDSGAASGMLDALWAIEAMRKGYAGGDRVLVWGASDDKLRAAAVFAAIGS